MDSLVHLIYHYPSDLRSQITDPDLNNLKGKHPNISSWFPCGADRHKVTWLPKFLRWIDYQHFLVYGTPLTGSSAMIYTVVKTSLMESQNASRSGWTWPITICGKKYSKFFYSSTFAPDPDNLVFTRLRAPESKVQSRGNDSIVLMTDSNKIIFDFYLVIVSLMTLAEN